MKKKQKKTKKKKNKEEEEKKKKEKIKTSFCFVLNSVSIHFKWSQMRKETNEGTKMNVFVKRFKSNSLFGMPYLLF